ncbi:maleylpyruvate isomerase N-terminal domain-containing protein [Streptomyces sp. NBC_01013]|uniref:maleylpyruvate isomerase N-terminal domain-containing protein n=1 Tax=Streptomyces sp. NBC_01013 TaxID=2903718 RepID=UPI00386FC843|nr:maleylpyruvate isomerase N-terminal domain-containing protein [Streptomyces sp. NBC_01013]
MPYRFADIVDLYLRAASEFGRRLRSVRPEQWTAPTPCAEWDVRHLVNHATRGNLNYVLLLNGGPAADSYGSGTRTPWAAIQCARTPARCGSAPRRSESRVLSSGPWTTPSAP